LRDDNGKSAAYAALTPDGRFASWLQFAPDGLITWKGRSKAQDFSYFRRNLAESYFFECSVR
jgi:hypothetical protein